MKIEEVVELILFNLTVYQNKRFYDVLRVIVPYARDNWSALQLSPNVSSIFLFRVFFRVVEAICYNANIVVVLDEKHELC